ncbi:MAG: hypothetical protein ABWZ25_06720 [Chitinophagaceae bacterium]
MEVKEFSESLRNSQPGPELSTHLQALWYDAKGDWEKSHELIQDLSDPGSARIHAYLHRKEGDEGNAFYWYRRAGVQPFNGSLQEEWDSILREFLG